jgi:hypothetical protein
LYCFTGGRNILDSIFRKQTKKEVLKQLDRMAKELHLKVTVVEISHDHRCDSITDKPNGEETDVV